MGPLWYLKIIVALTPQTRSNATDEYEGSIPSLVTNDLWCNGNTTVFGTVVRGSNPCRSTNKLNQAK